jgi:hypothetical protein
MPRLRENLVLREFAAVLTLSTAIGMKVSVRPAPSRSAKFVAAADAA